MKAIALLIIVIAITMLAVFVFDHPVKADQQIDHGYAQFIVRAQVCEDHSILVHNDNQPKTSMYVEVLPDGRSDLIPLTAGNFTAVLNDGNGNQSETQHFRVGDGSVTRVPFLGHAIPGGGTFIPKRYCFSPCPPPQPPGTVCIAECRNSLIVI